MPIVRGDWWAQDQRPVLKDDADVESADQAAAGVTTAALADLNVTSEKISANALRRTVVCPLPDLAAGTTAPLSSAYHVWTPSKPIIIRDLGLTPLTSWIQTTVQSTVVGTLYAGDNAVATVVIPTTNAPGRGTRLAFGTISNASVSSGVALTFALPTASSAGMDAPAHALDIQYDSTA